MGALLELVPYFLFIYSYSICTFVYFVIFTVLVCPYIHYVHLYILSTIYILFTILVQDGWKVSPEGSGDEQAEQCGLKHVNYMRCVPDGGDVCQMEEMCARWMVCVLDGFPMDSLVIRCVLDVCQMDGMCARWMRCVRDG